MSSIFKLSTSCLITGKINSTELTTYTFHLLQMPTETCPVEDICFEMIRDRSCLFYLFWWWSPIFLSFSPWLKFALFVRGECYFKREIPLSAKNLFVLYKKKIYSPPFAIFMAASVVHRNSAKQKQMIRTSDNSLLSAKFSFQ